MKGPIKDIMIELVLTTKVAHFTKTRNATMTTKLDIVMVNYAGYNSRASDKSDFGEEELQFFNVIWQTCPCP